MDSINHQGLYCEYKKYQEEFKDEKEFQASFVQFIQQFTENDQLNMITQMLKKLPNNMFLKQLQQKLSSSKGFFSFLSPRNSNQKSKLIFLQEYYEARQQENIPKILEIIGSEDAITNLAFPRCLAKVKMILPSLQAHVTKLLEIVEHCTVPTLTVNLSFLHNILFFLLNESKLSQQQNNLVLSCLGQITSNMIIQFYHVLQDINQMAPVEFKQFKKNLQEIQTGQVSIETLQNLQNQFTKFELITKVATLKASHDVNSWLEQIFNLFLIQNNPKVNYQEEIMDAIALRLPVNDQIIQCYFLSLFTLWIISCQAKLLKYEQFFQNQVRRDMAVLAAVKKEEDQMTKILLNTIFYFNDEYDEGEMILENLVQNQWKLFKFCNLRINNNLDLFQPSIFKQVQNIVSHTAPSNIQKIFPDKQLQRLIYIVQLLQQKTLNRTLQLILSHLTSKGKSDISYYLSVVKKLRSDYSRKELNILLLIFCEISNVQYEHFLILRPFIEKEVQLDQINNLIIFLEETNNSVYQKILNFNPQTWNFIKEQATQNCLVKFVNSLTDFYFQFTQKDSILILKSLKSIFPINGLEEKYLFLEFLLKNFKETEIDEIFRFNLEKKLSFEKYIRTYQFLMRVIKQMKEDKSKRLLPHFSSFFKFYKLVEIEFLIQKVGEGMEAEQLFYTLELLYYKNEENHDLLTKMFVFFEKDQLQYQKQLQYFNYFNEPQFQPEFLEKRLQDYNKLNSSINQNNNQIIDQLIQIPQIGWQFMKDLVSHEIMIKLVVKITDFYLENLQNSTFTTLSVLKLILPIFGLDKKYQLIELLLKTQDETSIHDILTQNSQNQLTLEQYLNTNQFLITVIKQIDDQQKQNLQVCFPYLFKFNQQYELDYIIKKVSEGQEFNSLSDLLELIYLNKNTKKSNLKLNLFSFYKKDQLQYQKQLQYFNYFNEPQFQPEFLEKRLQDYNKLNSSINQNNNQIIDQLIQIPQIGWQFMKDLVSHEIMIKLVVKITDFYLENLQNSTFTTLSVLKLILPIFGLDKKYQLIELLLKTQDETSIHDILTQNSQNQLTLEQYLNTNQFLITVIKQIDDQQKQNLQVCFPYLFKFNQQYELDYIIKKVSEGQEFNSLQIILSLFFYRKMNDVKTLTQQGFKFYKKDKDQYISLLQPFNFFNLEHLDPIQMERRIKYDQYPREINITLEDFNLSLALMSDDESKLLVKEWVKNMNDGDFFKKLIPMFFNILKRGESMKNFLSQINQEIKRQQLFKQFGYFNWKSLFQIFYNNSNAELQVMLLKLSAKFNPVPLIFRTPFSEFQEQELLSLNSNVFYVFQESYSIINFSLNEKQKRIGKTELINKIFYSIDKFEVSDNCEITKQTVDIMFDISFSGSRNLSIADVHDFIPLNILDRILPLFRLWIIQVDSESEIDETLESLHKLKSFSNFQKRKIFLFIRNSEPDKLTDDLLIKLQQNQITYQQIEDLTNKDLNKQMIESEIQSAAKQLYQFIAQNCDKDLVRQEDFLEIINSYHSLNVSQQQIQIQHNQQSNISQLVSEFQENNEVIKNLNDELNKIIHQQDGFYSQNAFPLRSLDYNLKLLKNEYAKESSKKNDTSSADKLLALSQKIKEQESKIPFQKPTKVLELFCSIFEKQNNYILYLWFVDKIRQFNEHHTYKLQDENQKLNEDIQKLKKEKDEIKKTQQDQSEGLDDKQKEIASQKLNKLIEEKKKELEKNLEIISLRNIGIEMFWREIIQQQQRCQDFKLQIDPAQVVRSMISKGEPFEFLDGDQLRIDSKFLESLIEQFDKKGQERILVFSVLGPQSSGKSTILNKIFGCHFWTSVGRCTKGIYLQLLKIHNRAHFNDLFDYILILDSEGLQNPNQEDQEFDKKIALFVLAISDIILINVKGDIHQQFKNLVEMCIFTLGQMRNFSSVKQISWCFNQNNDVSNFNPFLLQLQSILNNLNVQYNQSVQQDGNIDYNEILGISKSNISILGFASTEQTWRKNVSTGIYSDWRQQMLNETFSEEAYLYGLRIIKNYADKFKKSQENELQNLKCFIQVIENNWVSIQRLPDLLEFSELIQHQQNLKMKEEYDGLIKKRNISIANEILRDIHDQTLKMGGQITLNFLQTLQRDKQNEAKQTLDSIKEDFIQQLLAIKNEHKISKKIYSKYVYMITERIQSQYLECQLVIHNQIKNHETEYQKKKGFLQLDQYVSDLNLKPNDLKELQQDEKLIKQRFNEIWKKSIDEQKESQEKMFEEFAHKLFGIIAEEFKNYIMKSQYQDSYKKTFLETLIKNPPSTSDLDKIFEMFTKEIEPQQFMAIEKSQKSYQYSEHFAKKIQLKVENSSESDFIQIKRFYNYKITLFYVTQQTVKQYLKSDFKNDLKHFIEQKKKIHKRKEDLINQINGYFSQLSCFGISYEQADMDQFVEQVLSPGLMNTVISWFTSQDVSREYGEFLKKFQYDSPPVITNQTFELIKQNYYSLKQSQLEINCQDLTKDLVDSHIKRLSQMEPIIVIQQQQVLLVQEQLDYKNKKIFEYIKDNNSVDRQYAYNEFKSQITQTMSNLMSENNKTGWRKLYSEIYQMISKEIRIEKSSKEQMEEDETDINQYNVNLIQRIMTKIELMLKGFNKQFSNFGVIFNDIGERCIYYFSILVIWRYLCYGQWKIMSNSIEQLNAQTDEQYQKFKADIQQNKRQQSILRGHTLATEIYNLALENFYSEQTKEAEKIMSNYQNRSSYDLIQYLDKQILEKEDETVTEDQIMQYIQNHSGYIEKAVSKDIQKIVTEIQDKLQKLLRNEMKLHLNQVLFNTRNLKKSCLDPIKAKDYFISTDSEKMHYENILYRIVLSCLQGEQSKEIEFIKEDKRVAFEITGLKKIDVPLIVSVQSSSDQEIQVLMHFIDAFYEKINDQIQSCDNLQLSLSKLKVQTTLDEIKLVQIGCLESCPICKRKCDEDAKDKTHKHRCRNGHQLRGMNGVLINHNPSLFTCEEIQDEFQIEEQETKAIKRWKEIKNAYQNWQFSFLQNDELTNHKKKIMNIWNNKIGQMVCKKLIEILGVHVGYIPKQEIDPNNSCPQGKIHYVLMIDDSGSMTGRRWTNAKNGAVAFIWEIAKNKQAKLTVIIFNHRARCVIDFQDLDPEQQEKAIDFQDGCTDFDKAFVLAYDRITQQPNFDQCDSHQMFFYTDGYASYPKKAMNKFQSLKAEQKQKIELIACTEEAQSPVLEQIVQTLSQEFGQAKLRQSVQPEKMGQVWVETISRKMHKLEC